MKKIGLFVLASILLVLRPGYAAFTAPELDLNKDDRVLVFAPHPDDEILGTAGIIQKAVGLNIPIKIVFLTYGDNNAWAFTVYEDKPMLTSKGMEKMGELRRQEALNASKVLGLTNDHLVFLGYPDFGCMHIWLTHWGASPAFNSMFTDVTAVPYKDAYRYKAPYKGEEILKDVKSIIQDFKPTKIFVTNPADENPDHRAYYLITRVALWDLNLGNTVELHPYLVHYRFRHWPTPEGYHPTDPLVPPVAFQKSMDWMVSPLSPEQVENKHLAIQQHKTQYEYSGNYLNSFMRTNEAFGDFPMYTVSPSSAVLFEEGEGIPISDLPAEYSQSEKEQIIHVDKREISIEGDNLVIATSYKRKLFGEVALFVDVFGYRHDKPFETMPKIRVAIGEIVAKVFDQDKRLKTSSITIVREPGKITLKIPRALLGDPEYLLTGVQSNLEKKPLDVMSWRVLDLTK